MSASASTLTGSAGFPASIDGTQVAPPLPACGLDLGPGRRRVTQQDLDLYQALVGGPPQTVDADAAAAAEVAELAAASADSAGVRKGRTGWLPRVSRVLVLQLADCCEGLSVRIHRPELTSWVRRISHDARRKAGEAGARLMTSRGNHRA